MQTARLKLSGHGNLNFVVDETSLRLLEIRNECQHLWFESTFTVNVFYCENLKIWFVTCILRESVVSKAYSVMFVNISFSIFFGFKII